MHTQIFRVRDLEHALVQTSAHTKFPVKTEASALAIHGHSLQQFHVKVKTDHQVAIYITAANSSFSAYIAAADKQGDMPCSITVTRAARPAAASLS